MEYVLKLTISLVKRLCPWGYNISDEIHIIPNIQDLQYPIHCNVEQCLILIYCRKGCVEYMINDNFFKAKKGDLLLINKEQTLKCEKCSDSFQATAIMISDSIFFDVRKDSETFSSFVIWTHHFHIAHLNEMQRRCTVNFINYVTDLSQMNDLHSQFKRSSVINAISSFVYGVLGDMITKEVERIFHNLGKMNFSLKSYDETFFVFCVLVDKYYKDHCTLNFYSDQLRVSTRTLTRIVNKCVHKTPKAWINERRINEFKRLLIQTSLPVYEIEQQMNSSNGKLAKLFTRREGITPNQFRQTVVQNEQYHTVLDTIPHQSNQ